MCFPLLAAIPALGAAGAAGAGAAGVGAAAAGTAAAGAAAAGAAGAAAGAGLAAGATAGVLGTGLTAAQLVGLGGLALSATSTIAGGIAQNQSSKTNEALANREAVVAGTASSLEQQRIATERRALAGAQNVAAAKSGRGFSGSILDVVQQSNVNSELDILSASFGGQVRQASALGDAAIARSSRKGAIPGAIFGAGTTLLTGGARILNQ